MSKSGSSKQWLKEHFDDMWVRKAQEEGYRSRAVYKLIEINQKDRLIKPGMVVVDLGAAPGGWSQVAERLVKPGGMVLASDILDMEPVGGVDFIKGDFTEESVFTEILTALGGRPVDLVMSDMAPNMSGMSDIDQPKAMYLIELAVDFAVQTLRPGGSLVMKVFQGEGFTELLQDLKRKFAVVVNRKPEASRSRSREVYVLAKDFRG
jgi:23S rRNA (uridine2552-2'-O)-methyltransferase